VGQVRLQQQGQVAWRREAREHFDFEAGEQPGKAAPMTAQSHKTTEEEEYEVQLRNLIRVVSACTLGLWSFGAGLLIATFYLL
jgi:hypothetical protein